MAAVVREGRGGDELAGGHMPRCDWMQTRKAEALKVRVRHMQFQLERRTTQHLHAMLCLKGAPRHGLLGLCVQREDLVWVDVHLPREL